VPARAMARSWSVNTKILSPSQKNSTACNISAQIVHSIIEGNTDELNHFF